MIKATTTQIVLHREEDFDMIQDTTTVDLVNEGGGRFITLTQYDSEFKEIVIRLDPTEIQLLFETINKLISQ